MRLFGLQFGKSGTTSTRNRVGIVIADDGLSAVHIGPAAGDSLPLLAHLQVRGDNAASLDALARWSAEHGLRNTPAALCLDYGQYAIHQLDKPDVPEAEIRQALRWRLKDLIDYSPTDAVIDLFQTPPSRQKRIEPVQVVAARASRLKPLVAGIKAAGLDLQRIDIPEFALRNLISRALGMNETTAVLHLLALRGTLQICREDAFYFARVLDQGQEALARAGHGGLADVDDRIALEVQRTMDYYDSHFGHGPVKKLIILGEGDGLQRLADYTHTALGLNARVVGAADLLSGLPADASPHPLLALATGGALGIE